MQCGTAGLERPPCFLLKHQRRTPLAGLLRLHLREVDGAEAIAWEEEVGFVAAWNCAEAAARAIRCTELPADVYLRH
eukprot:SAG11_NODE_15766_length_567_cov_0.739316_1_plen_76_part_01